MCPDAEPDDGLFDVLLIGDVTKRDLAFVLPKTYTGKHLPHPRLELLRGSVVTVDADEPLPIELDGEQPGTTPARFEVVPRALRLRVPRSARPPASRCPSRGGRLLERRELLLELRDPLLERVDAAHLLREVVDPVFRSLKAVTAFWPPGRSAGAERLLAGVGEAGHEVLLASWLLCRRLSSCRRHSTRSRTGVHLTVSARVDRQMRKSHESVPQRDRLPDCACSADPSSANVRSFARRPCVEPGSRGDRPSPRRWGLDDRRRGRAPQGPVGSPPSDSGRPSESCRSRRRRDASTPGELGGSGRATGSWCGEVAGEDRHGEAGGSSARPRTGRRRRAGDRQAARSAARRVPPRSARAAAPSARGSATCTFRTPAAREGKTARLGLLHSARPPFTKRFSADARLARARRVRRRASRRPPRRS